MEMLELAAELKGCREQIAAYEVERAQMQQYYRRAIADRDDAKATISRLRDELASWQEAFGLLTTLHGSIQIDSSDPMGMAKQIESHVRAENTDLLTDLDRVLRTLRYLIGIAKRGEGRPMAEDETAERFVLGYVKRLEAELAELRKPDCFRCAYWFACRTLIKDDCGGGDKFVPKRDPVRLYEKEEK